MEKLHNTKREKSDSIKFASLYVQCVMHYSSILSFVQRSIWKKNVIFLPILDSFPLLSNEVNIANITYILEIAHFQVLLISPVDVFFCVNFRSYFWNFSLNFCFHQLRHSQKKDKIKSSMSLTWAWAPNYPWRKLSWLTPPHVYDFYMLIKIFYSHQIANFLSIKHRKNGKLCYYNSCYLHQH